jgi:two-component system OmpR family response regulator/two-component system response regulator QseB
LNPALHQVWLGERTIDLLPREYKVLHIFMLNAGRVLTRDRIEQHLYQWGTEVSSNTVEVYVHKLRKKLNPNVIETLRGVGYVLPQQIKA